MNGTMDNLEERIANLEMMFAYLKNKKMLKRQENKPNKETPSSDGTADEDIAEFEVASKSKSFTSKPKKGLVTAHTWACTSNKTFGTRKPKDAIVAGQAIKGKKKIEILILLPILCLYLFTTVSKQWLQILTSPDFTDKRRKIPNLDPPAGIFSNHRRRLFKYEFVSLDPRLESRKSAMDNSFTLGSNKEGDHVKILQSCNGLLLCIGSGSPAYYYVYNPSTNLFKRLLPLENSHDDPILHATGVFRMAFDPTKSRDYKVVRNFLQYFGGREGSYDPMFIYIDIPGILQLQRRLFESRGCLLLVCRDDIDSKEFTIYEMVKGCPVWMVRSLFECDLVSLDSRLNSEKSTMDHSFGSAEEVDHVRILQSCNALLLSGVSRLAFDPRKSVHYKVVQAGGEYGETWIQIYSSKTGNWNFYKDRFSYFSFDHFESAIYWNEAFHWLEGLHKGRNFLESFGRPSNDPILLLMEIPHVLHLEGNFFESCGCPLLVCRDDIGFTEFTIYEMMKGYSVWSVRICLGEGEEDAFVVINLSEKVVKYNLISKTNIEIFDIGSNQMDDDDDAVVFIPPFKVDPNLYEFIMSLAKI
ncbi:hypothetical protein Tco_0720378 [Tanacetum coccineum]